MNAFKSLSRIGLLLCFCLCISSMPARAAVTISAVYDTPNDTVTYQVGTSWDTWVYTSSVIEIQLDANRHMKFQHVANVTANGSLGYNGTAAMYNWGDVYAPCGVSRRYKISSQFVQFWPIFNVIWVDAYSEWDYVFWYDP